jgi:hypothetical protein
MASPRRSGPHSPGAPVVIIEWNVVAVMIDDLAVGA